MAALGMGILLSFLMKKAVHFCIFMVGFILVVYLNLNSMAVAVIAIIVGVIYYTIIASRSESEVALDE